MNMIAIQISLQDTQTSKKNKEVFQEGVRSLNKKINYSELMFKLHLKSFPFASLFLNLSRNASPSEPCYPVKEFA